MRKTPADLPMLSPTPSLNRTHWLIIIVAAIGFLFGIRLLARKVGREFQCQIGVDLQIHETRAEVAMPDPSTRRRINVI